MSVQGVTFKKRSSSKHEVELNEPQVDLKPPPSQTDPSSSDDAVKPMEGGDGGQRGGWGNKIEFILAIIGYAVGLGNVWRFPYLCQKNGGGAFIIPYAISLMFIGVPIFFLELSIGQRLRKGPLGVWNTISPYFSGLGLSSVVVSFLVGVYYNMLVAWCLYYFFISFAKTPPFAVCPKVNGVEVEECRKAGSTSYYWYRTALETTDSIEEGGGLNWKMVGCLVGAWLLLFVIVFRGVQSVGKAVYFTALFPYIVLIIFFIRGVTLEGAGAGVEHMFKPDFEHLKKPEVWLEASTQIFYSLGLAFGGLIAMASYNPINNNVLRDAIMVSTINCGTSIFASIVIFCILGFKATKRYNECLASLNPSSTSLNNTMSNSTMFNNTLVNTTANTIQKTCDLQTELNNVAQGPGLTFIAFTEAISWMDVKPLWSLMFFLMLMTLGMGSMIGTFECVRTTIVDLQIIPLRKEFVTAILCMLSCAFGLLFCQRSGEYWLQMFDSYAGTIGLLIIGFFEMVLVCYVYGYKRFEKDIHYMLGKFPSMFWKIMWMGLAPFLLVSIVIASIYSLISETIGYEAWNKAQAKVMLNTPYPKWGEALCFILISASALFIPIVAVLKKYDLFNIKDNGLDEHTINMQKAGIEDELHVSPNAITSSMSRVPLTEFEK